MPPPSVELQHVSKRFGPTLAVDNLSLTLGTGEFFSLLGPSGCGKTTTLRLIGGLEHPDQGSIRIAGEVVTTYPPYARRANIVFQNYALFPHLTVWENIAFGLHMQRTPAAEMTSRVAAALELVQLAGFDTRRPQQLSGGQQQRVALARALVLRPQVLLLDEPLGALDRQLRKAMQRELRLIQQEVRMTFLYVTHDHEEALSMSDRLAIMHHGRLEQIGTPQQIYQTPRTKFVADFMGAANILSGRVTAVTPQGVRVETAGGLGVTVPGLPEVVIGAMVNYVVRPEAVQLVPVTTACDSQNTCAGRIHNTIYLGEVTEVEVVLDGGVTITSRVPSRLVQQYGYRKNDPIRLSWQSADSHLLPA